jgi:hypothetical protein
VSTPCPTHFEEPTGEPIAYYSFFWGGRIYTQRYRFRSADIAPNRGRSRADLTAQLEDAPR